MAIALMMLTCSTPFRNVFWIGAIPTLLQTVGRSDMNEGWMLKESHTYEKCPTKMQQASHNQTTNKILSHFYQLI
jgi:hypothetical protein